MTPDLTHKGDAELAKGVIHLALLSLAVTAGCYNLVTMTVRPSRHLALNSVAYLAIVVFEARHVLSHMRAG
jgi:hypothetical protein